MNEFLVVCMMLCTFSSTHALTFDQAMQLYVQKDYGGAYHELNNLAQLGNTKAQLNIAVMFARGEFVIRKM